MKNTPDVELSGVFFCSVTLLGNKTVIDFAKNTVCDGSVLSPVALPVS